MKITIEVETETSKERVKAFVKRFCSDSFFKEAKVEIEDEKQNKMKEKSFWDRW